MKRFIFASALISAALFAGAAAVGAPALGGDAVKGKASFFNNGRYTCHGTEGQGAAATGKKLAPNPMAYAAFSGFVRTTSRHVRPSPNRSCRSRSWPTSTPICAPSRPRPIPATIPLLQEAGK